MTVAGFSAQSVLTALTRPSASKRANRWRNALPAAAFALAAAMAMPAYAVTTISGTTNASTLTGDSTFDTTQNDTLVLDNALVGNTLTYNLLNNNTGFTSAIDVDGNTSTISGAISGIGDLTFEDSVAGGSVTLTNVNTYVGSTTIDNTGNVTTVKLSGAGSLASSSSIIDNGVFDISGITSGTSSIVSLAGTNGSASVVLGSKTLNITLANDSFAGNISGSGNLKISDGTETLTGANGYTGTTTINGTATLALSGSGSVSNLSSVIDAGTFDISATTTGASIKSLSSNGIVNLGGNTLTLSSASGAFAGAINDGGLSGGTGGGLTLTTGTETLSGANTYTGTTTINGGTLKLNIASSISSSGDVVVNSPGVFDVSLAGASIKSLDGDGTVSLGSQTLTLTNAGGDFTGVIQGSGGNLTIHSGTETLTNTNTYDGTTTIDGGGVLALSGSGDIHLSDGVTDNGTFDISQDTGPTVSITSLAGSFTSHVYLGANTLILTSASGTYNGIIADAGGLGVGTGGGLHIFGGSETLSNAETYTGDTTIDSGAFLHLSGAGSLASSTVNDNGTLDISVAGGSTSIKSLKDSAGPGSVTLGGNLLTLVNAGDTFDGVISGASGSLALTAGAETLTGINTYSGSTAINGGTLALSGTGGIEDSSSVTVASGATFDISQTSSGASIKTLAGAGHVDLGGQVLTLTDASTTFSGILEDGGIGGGTGGGLTIDSTGGTETLSGANTYTGTTTITDGTLRAGAAGAFSQFSDVVMAADPNAILDLSGSGYNQTIKSLSGSTVAIGGTVKLGANTLTITNGSNGGTWDGTISGTGGINVNGGTFNVDGSNTYTGLTEITSGTLEISGSGNIAQSSRVDVSGGATFDIQNASSSLAIKSLSGASTSTVTLGANTLSLTSAGGQTFSGIIGGTGGFTVSSGNETLSSNTNTYTGLTTVSGTLLLTGSDSILASSGVSDLGTFDISGNGATTSIKTLYGNGIVTLGGNTLILTNAGPTSTGNFSGAINGVGGGLTINGGTETLAGANTYTGNTTISGGTLSISGTTILSSAKVIDNSALIITSNSSIQSLTGNGTVNLGSVTLTLTAANDNFSGIISGGGGLSVTGTGIETLSGVNTYSGTTTIASGATLVLGSGGSIADSRVVDDGILDASAGSTSIQSLSGASTGSVLLASGATTLTLTAASDTFAGVISGGDATSIFEIAAGSETLTGVNTYTGTTQIDNGGVLKLTDTGSIAGSAGVDDNGNFDISGTASGATITELYGNGSVSLGSQTLTISNAETGVVATNTFAGAIGGSGGLTIAAGWEELTGTQNYSGATTIDNLATLVLGSGAQLSLNSNVEDEGSLILSGTTTIKSLTSILADPGSVTLGTYTLTIQNASGTFYGDIGVDAAGGGLTIAQGTQTLTGTNGYTGATTINTGATLAIAGLGDISASSGVADSGTFDISGATVAPANVSITALTGSGSGKVYLGQNTLIVTAASGTFSGVIADAGGIVNVAGGGIEIAGGSQTLAGVNTYTGTTLIDNLATLALSGSGSIATSSDVTDNGTFDVSAASNPSVGSLDGTDNTATVVLGTKTLKITNAGFVGSGDFAGDIGSDAAGGGLEIVAGTQSLSGTNALTGTTTIDNGATLILASGGSIASSSVNDKGALDVSAGDASIQSLSGNDGTATVTLGSTYTLTLSNASGAFSGVIGGGGSLEIAAGTETLKAANTYTGATIIDNGATLALTNSGAISTSSGVQADGTFDIHLLGSGTAITSLKGVASGSVVLGFNTLTISNANPLDTFSGVISGSGGLTLTTGTETLGGTNTYTGATTLNGGTLALTGTGSIATSSGVAVGSGATLDISQTTSGASIVTLSGSGHADLGGQTLTLTAANNTFSGIIEDGGILAGTGGGLTVTGTETLSGVNTYTGTTTINASSTVALSLGGSIAGSSVADNGTFDISGISAGSTSIVSLSGSGNVTLGGKTLAMSDGTGTFSGILSGTGGVTLDSSGTETFSGANTYSGLTTINTGTLALTGTGTIASSSGVADNGTFDISAITSGTTSISTLTGSGAVALGAKTLIITAGGGNTFNGSIGDGGLGGGIEILAGIEKLAGATTYLGSTTVDSGAQLWILGSGDASSAASVVGTLNLSNASGTVSFKSLSGNGTVTLGTHTLLLATASGSYSGGIGGSGGFEIAGGTETLTSSVNYTGATIIDSGANLVLTGAGAIQFTSGVQADGNFSIAGTSSGTTVASLSGTSSGTVTLGSRTLTLSSGTGTFGGVIGGTGGLNVNGSGTETLSGINTYSGATAIGSGETLAITGTGSLANSAVAVTGIFDITGTTTGTSIKSLSGSGTVKLGSKLLTLVNASGTFSGIIEDPVGAGLEIAGGTETLTGANTYTGHTTIDAAATLKLSGTGSIENSNGVTDNGTFDISGVTPAPTDVSITTLDGNGNVVLGSNTLVLTAAGGDFGGVISGTGGLEIAAGTETLSGSNTYSGATTIDSGATLIVTGSLNVASAITNNGTLIMSGALTTAVLNGSGNLGIATSLTLTGPGIGNYSGILSGVGDLIVGNGTHNVDQTLTNAETYTGSTTIGSDGTLRLATSGTSGSIATSSSLIDNGVFDISGLTTGSSSIKTLSGTGSVTLGSNTLTLTAAADTFSGIISGTGGLTLTSGTETLTGNNTFGGNTTISGGTLQLGDGTSANGTVGGNIVDNAALKFDYLGTASYGGAISGTGTVEQVAGTTVLTGTNTYSGSTTIDSGATLQIGNGGTAGSIANTSGVTDGGTLAFDRSDNVSFGAGITGGGTVEQDGAGTLTLSGSNSYSGGTTINSGAISISANNNLGTGSLNMQNGTTLYVTASGTFTHAVSVTGDPTFNIAPATTTTWSGLISGTGDVDVDGGGTLALTNTGNTYSGGTTVLGGSTLLLDNDGEIGATSGGLTLDNGTLKLGASFNLAGTRAVALGAGGGTINTNTFNTTVSQGISGSGALTKSGTGTLTLTAANSYTGATTISAGTLALTGSGSVSTSSGVADNATFDISGITAGSTAITSLSGNGGVTLGAKTLEISSASGTFSGIIGGTGGLTLDSGTETLSGANSYTGLTTISGGTLALSGTGSISNSSGVADSGTFDISALTGAGTSITTITGNGAVVLGAKTLTLTAASGSFGGSIGGTGALAIIGGTETLTGSSTFTGGTTVSGGATLILSADNELGGATSGLTLDNGTLQFAASFDLASTRAFALGAGGGTVNTNGFNSTVSQAISGSGALTKTGAGTLTLAANNTYTGTTTISAGTLTLTGSGSIAASSGVTDNATFDITGTTSGASIEGLSGSGSVLAAGKTLTITNSGGTFSGVISGSGANLEVSGGTTTLSGANTYDGSTTIDSGATLALSGTGSIASSSGVADAGTFNISATTSGASIATLSGTGAVTLGAQTLTLTAASGTFSGAIGGTGGLTLSAGNETLSGTNTYSGATNINGGTLSISSDSNLGGGSLNIGNGATLATTATNTYTHAATLTGSAGLNVASATTATWSGLFSGTGSLNLTGGGTLALTNTSDSYTGGTRVAGSSTLLLTNDGELGGTSGGLTLDNGMLKLGASFNLAGTRGFALGAGGGTINTNGFNTSVSQAISGSGGLTKSGTGTLTLTAANTYTGTTTISGGTLALTGSGSIAASSSVADNATLDVSANGASIKSLSGTGGVTLGANTLTITNGNSLDLFSGTISGTGGLTISGGTFSLSGGGAITATAGVTDNGTFDIASHTGDVSITTLAGNGSVVLGSNTLILTNAGSTFSGVISGAGGLEIAGGTETLTGANTYTGATTIDTGATLILSGSGSLSSGSTLIIASGGTFDASGSSATSMLGALSGGGNLVLGSGGLELTGGTGSYSGVLSGTGGLTVDNGVDQTLTGVNTYTGATTIDAGGSLSLTGTGSIADSSGVTDNGTFDISGLTNGGTTITSLSGSGNVELGSNTLTLSNASGTFSGVISDPAGGSLVIHSGTEILTGANTYTGGTTIDSGATLQLGDGTSTSGSLVGDVADNGTFAFDYDGASSFGGAITGTGHVSLIGGTLTLTGTNDYTGGTTIGAATLVVASEDNLGTGAITMDDGSSIHITSTASFNNAVTVTGDPTFIVAPSTTTTWNGAISGAGDVVVTGGGTLVLTNASNSYTLGTIVEGSSTLTIDADGEIGNTAGGLTLGDASTSGTLKLGASFNLAATRAFSLGAGGGTIDTNTFNTTVSQAITGSGALTKTGTGTLILAANNSYGGGTTISAGTLQLGNGTGIAGSVTGNILDNAALAFDYSGTAAAYSGVISGSGTVTQMAGTTVLTGTNLYTGLTTISGGTLQLGNGGTAGSIDDTSGVTDNGTLAFNRSDAVSFGTLITGSGGLTQLGTGTLTLTANNTFTGTTTISAGTLSIGNGGTTGAVAGNIVDNAALIFDRSNALTYAGVISGTGTVTKASTGTLTLTGASTYHGVTTVNAGTLVVNGSISSSAVDVLTGTTLAGTGTVGSTTVENGATLSPGVGGVGTLNVTGTIHFASTSNYAVDVSGTSATADKVIVSGAATIDGGDITLTNLGGSYLPGQQFTLLTASSVGSHAFTLVGADAFGPNLHGTLDYSTATAIILKLKLKDLLPILQAHDPNATRNETSVITAIDHANDAGDTLPASFLNLPSLTSSGQLGAAADQMSGEIGAAAPQVATSLISPFMTTMFDHMTSLSIGNDGTKAGSIAGPGPMPAAAASYAGFRDIHDKLGLWVSAFGGDGSTTGVPTSIGSTDVNMTTAGISGGVDFHVSPYFMMGASLMGGHTSFDLSGQRGTGASNAFEGGLYGLVHGTGFYVAAAGAYSSQSMSTDRTVAIPSVTPTAGDHLSSSFTATDYGGRLETGVYVNWLTPYIAVQTLSFHSPAYSEKGTAPSTDFALSYDALSMTTTRFELGTGFGTDLRMASNSIVNMWGRVAWAHDLIPDQKTDVAFSGLPGSGFTIYGAQPASDSALVSLGAIVKGRNGLDFMARVDSDISGPSKSYIGTLGLNFTW
jgi:fibronectin-binding autotransporter adhesin